MALHALPLMTNSRAKADTFASVENFYFAGACPLNSAYFMDFGIRWAPRSLQYVRGRPMRGVSAQRERNHRIQKNQSAARLLFFDRLTLNPKSEV